MMRLSDLLADLAALEVIPPKKPRASGREPRGGTGFQPVFHGQDGRATSSGLGARGCVVARVTADSRLVQPGVLFVAVRGTKTDGHRYVNEAIRAGAAAVVVEERTGGPAAEGVWQLVVGDSRAALARAAAALAGHPSRRLTAVGVTGTNGKTTTAILIHAILQAAGRRPGLIGTIRYEVSQRAIPASLTTPDSVVLQTLMADMVAEDLDSVVMEVSSHALDQRRTSGIDFDAGVFTHLTSDHGDYHLTREAYARAKRRLFEDLKPAAAAVFNRADPVSADFAAHTRARQVWYGAGAEVHASVEEMTLEGTRFALHMGAETAPVRTRLVGRHNVENALAAAGAGVGLGLPLAAIRAGIEAVEAIPGRLERVEAGQPFHVLVDFAHTDDALGKVLASLRPLVPGRLVAVFGAGGDRDRAKRPRMGRVAAEWADAVWITSDNPRSEDPAGIVAEIAAGIPPASQARVRREVDRGRAIHAALAEAERGDLVLIAGKGHERTQKFADVEIPFDDCQVAREALLARVRPRAAG